MSAGNSFTIQARRGAGAHRAFTLVELLVVIAIIGVLVGLVMPAIVNARMTALQATCANNQRELANAMILYDSNKDRLPYSAKVRGGTSYSWYTQILEELGLGKQHQQFLDGNLGAQPIKQFKCPAGDAKVNGINYVANMGQVGQTCSEPNPGNAVRGSGLLFYHNGNRSQVYTKSSIASIKDGASMTILLSESVHKIPGGFTSHGPAENWIADGNGEGNVKVNFGLLWNSGAKGSQAISAYYPNFPSSRHSQVCNVAFADGSVRAVAKSIFYNTYISLMCPNDSYVDKNLSYANDPNFRQ